MNDTDKSPSPPLLDVRDLRVHFRVPGLSKPIRAVDGVSLSISAGETLGLVGESGCGKTTLSNAIMGLVAPLSGSITFRSQSAIGLSGSALRRYRRQLQMVFQDPFGSLNPRMTVGRAISEVLKIHHLAGDRASRSRRTGELLRSVGLEPDYASRYPHEFSGGQRQRIGIARALATEPSLVIADEPVSALDVSVQVQILNLLRKLQKDLGLAYLLIAHDLAVVRYMCERVMVMYLGRIVESSPADTLFSSPAHPYTEALLSAVPDIDNALSSRSGKRRRIILRGDVPSPAEVIPGCPFHPRCHRATSLCSTLTPPVRDLGNGHTSVCHFPEAVMATAQARPA